jgi:hypothetical protein
MEPLAKRFFIFIFGCIFLRICIVAIAYYIDINYLPYMGYITTVIGIGFLIIFLGGYRKSGPETYGDTIWWNHLRPIHGILYLLFSYFAIQKNRNAYGFLLVDVIIGFLSGMNFHYKHGYLSK